MVDLLGDAKFPFAKKMWFDQNHDSKFYPNIVLNASEVSTEDHILQLFEQQTKTFKYNGFPITYQITLKNRMRIVIKLQTNGVCKKWWYILTTSSY
jgi:hypothetical protein